MFTRTTPFSSTALLGCRVALLYITLFVWIPCIEASDPGWWTDPATRIIDPAHTDPDRGHRSPANLGQLKHVAAMARAHLDTYLPDGAGPEIDALVAAFDSPEQSDDDPYAPVLIGQLKALAKPYYDRLMTFSFDTRYSLQVHGLPPGWAYDYPWPPAPPAMGQPGYDPAIRAAWVEGNFAPALLGQLKLVFSFDLSAPAGELPEWWVDYYFPNETGVSANGDPDNDGLTNLQELGARTSPLLADTDTDGMSDGYELANGLDPRSNDTMLDKDGDLIPNREDARPNDINIGRLTISISTPANGGNFP